MLSFEIFGLLFSQVAEKYIKNTVEYKWEMPYLSQSTSFDLGQLVFLSQLLTLKMGILVSISCFYEN